VYIGGDENSQRWIRDFKQQLVAVPEKLENVDGTYVDCMCVVCDVCVMLMLLFDCLATQYVALMIPNCPGAAFDLWQNDSMSKILHHFMTERSEQLVCICKCYTTSLQRAYVQ